MNRLRLEEKNKLKIEIKDILFLNDRDDETIINIKKLTNNTFNTNKIVNLNNNITQRKENIIKIEKRLVDLSSGILDEELQIIRNESTQIINNKYKESNNKKNQKKKEKEEDQKISKKYYIDTRKNDREFRYYNNGVNRETKYYYKKSSTIPEYMIKNLKTMPNNKGYIWRGIHCYGDKPSKNDKHTILFEKRKGVLTIHEWIRGSDFTQYIISEKNHTRQKNKILSNIMKKNIK
tara:strand:+ start:198 stop:902 length:705 start_codon:yes stop_codon:yes gene_type:complete